MKYRIISLLAMVAMTACGMYVIMYRWEHPYRGVFKILLRRWWILLAVLVFALIAFLGWHRHHRQASEDAEDEPDDQ